MRKQWLSVILLIVLALLTASVSRASEWLSTLEPLCSVADSATCTPKECGARSCGMLDRGCGLGTVDCGVCADDQVCKRGICSGTPKCPCGGHWPNACQKCSELTSKDAKAGLGDGECPCGGRRGACRACLPPGTEAIKPKPGDDNDCACGPPFHRPCRICTPDELAAMAPFCASKKKSCGLIDNGHGGKADCGTCKEPETCGGGGVPNVCGQPQKKK